MILHFVFFIVGIAVGALAVSNNYKKQEGVSLDTLMPTDLDTEISKELRYYRNLSDSLMQDIRELRERLDKVNAGK